MATGDNWTKEETPKGLKKKAEILLKQIKEKRKGKKYRLIKICDSPLTIKEIEIK